ncbi:MAG: DUF6776 family protein [Oceanisphaera sp.]|uniref:DUF6776 family protein n=1 Tax=Oceanisphaera sp. TaxID=1929979 RepID=UPI003F9DBD79
MPSPFSRRLMVLSLLSMLLLLITGYLGLRYAEQDQLLAQHRLAAERDQQALLALRVDLQTLLSAEESQLALLDAQAEQLSEQAQELALYRQVLSPVGGELLLTQEEVVALAEPGMFAYRLVLFQPTQSSQKITGQARLSVRALHKEHSVILTDDMLGVAPVSLDFRHFQVLTGQLRLPVDSQARTLELRLTLNNRADRTLSLNWPIPDNT